MALAENKKAYFDYNILEIYEAGIVLFGYEVKSVTNGRINLSGTHIVIRDGEAWLLNADIPSYQPQNTPLNYDSKRTRKLLLNKFEISTLIGKTHEKGLTLVPLRAYIKGHKIKVEIGLAKSKNKSDKREAIRKKDDKREMRKARS
ncbi:SsrA-binding protein [Candidatus Wolfebacteria bacterium CG10_big_fil_rev_8_21_14_0_10_31_9]|uniref:SsrA-binding protein n=1 Tax=Candidatus Wolfebacteria bacterium CG10_big_fil_rev_8_21_14_0_10_31_9 TaxID=1975070 RepID=A0A2H0RBX8_9BACT|nr:MAG: SsrA-binding protein [Candidatus Wolfebacteria bacterium CG10_big_fil_rev_8_21_14_0_10_31_9]